MPPISLSYKFRFAMSLNFCIGFFSFNKFYLGIFTPTKCFLEILFKVKLPSFVWFVCRLVGWSVGWSVGLSEFPKMAVSYTPRPCSYRSTS